MSSLLIKTGHTYAARQAGDGFFATWNLIDRQTFDLVDMTFDNEDEAEEFATDRGALIDNSSLDD